ncbi:MAG: hypothetical protein ACJ74W_01350 [Pyrinomonadaceae bacterium]
MTKRRASPPPPVIDLADWRQQHQHEQQRTWLPGRCLVFTFDEESVSRSRAVIELRDFGRGLGVVADMEIVFYGEA